MHWARPKGPRASGASTIDVLIGVAVVVLVLWLALPHLSGTRATPAATPTTAIGEAGNAVCQTNLSVIRQLITTKRLAGPLPSSLSELGLGAGSTRCAVGGEPYSYSTATGEVHCPHGGHESY